MQFANAPAAAAAGPAGACPPWLRHALTAEAVASVDEVAAAIAGLQLYFIGDLTSPGLFKAELFQNPDHFRVIQIPIFVASF